MCVCVLWPVCVLDVCVCVCMCLCKLIKFLGAKFVIIFEFDTIFNLGSTVCSVSWDGGQQIFFRILVYAFSYTFLCEVMSILDIQIHL